MIPQEEEVDFSGTVASCFFYQSSKFKAKAFPDHLTDDLRASIVPIDFAVSGVPSPFLLFSGSLAMSIECLVSVLLKPTVFFVIEPSFASCPDVACQIVSRINCSCEHDAAYMRIRHISIGVT